MRINHPSQNKTVYFAGWLRWPHQTKVCNPLLTKPQTQDKPLRFCPSDFASIPHGSEVHARCVGVQLGAWKVVPRADCLSLGGWLVAVTVPGGLTKPWCGNCDPRTSNLLQRFRVLAFLCHEHSDESQYESHPTRDPTYCTDSHPT